MNSNKPAKTPTQWPGKFKVDYPGADKEAPYPWKFQCQAPLCFYCIVAPTEAILDERIERHPCPWFGGGTTTFSWGVMSDTYLVPIWKLLDEQVDIIKGDAHDFPTEKYTAAQNKARGMAQVLAVLMPPFFSSADEIVREAVKRWEKRQAGENYETPGIGRLKWKQPEPEATMAFAKRVEFDPEEEPASQLSDEDKNKIRQSKAFPSNMLAAAYGVPESTIKWYWKH